MPTIRCVELVDFIEIIFTGKWEGDLDWLSGSKQPVAPVVLNRHL